MVIVDPNMALHEGAQGISSQIIIKSRGPQSKLHSWDKRITFSQCKSQKFIKIDCLEIKNVFTLLVRYMAKQVFFNHLPHKIMGPYTFIIDKTEEKENCEKKHGILFGKSSPDKNKGGDKNSRQ